MSWKVSIDPTKCQGYACCVMTAPRVFDMDEDTGKAVVIDPEPDDAMRSLCDKAVRGCPTHAISIDES